MTHQTEKTPEGVQVLVTGVRPVTDRDRLAMLAALGVSALCEHTELADVRVVTACP